MNLKAKKSVFSYKAGHLKSSKSLFSGEKKTESFSNRDTNALSVTNKSSSQYLSLKPIHSTKPPRYTGNFGRVELNLIGE